MRLKFLVFITCALSFSAYAGNVAVVKLIRGEVDSTIGGKTSRLKVDDWVSDGAVVKTAEKSFVKLVFIDKSQMNIGPSSEMKIEKFDDKDSGVIDLVKGKIRSQVTKDYLQIQDKDKSKLFIKTKTAVLGVRGTDFMVSTNGENTATVLFEGEVVFNKLDQTGNISTANLEQIVDQGVRILPGEFSVVELSRPEPTLPSVLNVQQREKLENNVNFESDRSPSSANTNDKGSIVPPGLNGSVVSNSSETIKTEISQAVKTEAPAGASAAKGDAAGFVSGNQVKPANGSFIHVDSGVIIPPDSTGILDKNTNTYISSKNGTVGNDGNYVPPKNVEITLDGKILVSVTDSAGAVKVQEVAKPVAVVTANPVNLTNVGTEISQSGTAAASAISGSATRAPSNDILNKNFVPSGLSDISNNQRNAVGGGISTINDAVIIKTHTDTTINVSKEP